MEAIKTLIHRHREKERKATKTHFVHSEKNMKAPAKIRTTGKKKFCKCVGEMANYANANVKNRPPQLFPGEKFSD
jgi:hypothetical protein